MPNITKLVLVTLCTVPVALCTVLGTFDASAHHSYAHFDQKKCKTLAGTVKKWEFTYPHTWLWVTTKDADDSDVLFGFEGSDPASLAIYGWTPELLFKGDSVTVSYNPLRDGRNGGSIRSVVLPTGKTIQGQGSNSDLFFSECEESDPEYVSDQTVDDQNENDEEAGSDSHAADESDDVK